MSPSIVLKDKSRIWRLVRQADRELLQELFRGIINAIDFDMNPEQLVNAPYVNCLTKGAGTGGGIRYFSGYAQNLLEERGHKPVCIEADQAMSTMVNSVMLKDGEYYAAGTKRVDEGAAVFSYQMEILF